MGIAAQMAFTSVDYDEPDAFRRYLEGALEDEDTR